MYKSGNKYVAATSTNPDRRYTNQVRVGSGDPAATRDTVGGANKPLDTVAFTVTDKDGTNTPPTAPDRATEIPTFQSNKAGGEFRLAYGLPGVPAGDYTAAAREFTVDATFDIDVYQAKDTTASGADYPAYTSGYGRAYVSSGSDSGQWVTIMEVAEVNDDHDADGSPTSNLFRGMVVITNDNGPRGRHHHLRAGRRHADPAGVRRERQPQQRCARHGDRADRQLPAEHQRPQPCRRERHQRRHAEDILRALTTTARAPTSATSRRSSQWSRFRHGIEDLDTTHKGTGDKCTLADGCKTTSTTPAATRAVWACWLRRANAKFSQQSAATVVKTGERRQVQPDNHGRRTSPAT